jgi:hypothetical protein
MRTLFLALAALGAAVPGLARPDPWQQAEERPYAPHFVVGVRSGYSWGLGDVAASMSLRDFVGFQVPVQLDVGFRLTPELLLGGYASYGFSRPTGATKDLCDGAGVSCSASALRGGVQLVWYLSDAGSQSASLWRDPRHGRDDTSGWVGFGAGYDSIKANVSGPGGSVDLSVSGLEAFVQGGIDVYATRRSALALYAQISIGRFTSGEVGGTSGTLSEQRFHEWLTVGLQAEFGR